MSDFKKNKFYYIILNYIVWCHTNLHHMQVCNSQWWRGETNIFVFDYLDESQQALKFSKKHKNNKLWMS